MATNGNNPKTLHLTVQRKSWDMLKKGEKNEEYLDPKYYWYLRLLDVDREGYGYFCPSCEGDFEDLFRESEDSYKEFTRLLDKAIEDGIFEYKHFDCVKIHLGHRQDNTPYLLFKLESISIGTGRTEWGAEPDHRYFIVRLGERIGEPEECEHYYVDGCHGDILCSGTKPMRGCYGICKNFKPNDEL